MSKFKKEIWNYVENNFRQVAETCVGIEDRVEFLESIINNCVKTDSDGNCTLSRESLDILIEDSKKQIEYYREQANTYNYYAFAFKMYNSCEEERSRLKALLFLRDNLKE